MISEDEGDVIFRQPHGCGAALTDSESELDGKAVETLVDLPVLIRIVVVVNQMMLT